MTEQDTQTPAPDASGAGPLKGSTSGAPAGAETLQDDSEQAPEGNGTGEQENGSEEHSGSKLHKEAAKYRTRAREAEQQRDALVARVEALQLREVNRLAGEHLAQPADLLALGGVTLAELLDEDGNVDPETVADAAEALIESRPGLAKNPKVSAVDHTQGTGNSPGNRKLDWVDLLKS
ncbi:hypothetical protein [Mycobacterium scrofulaceum]|uniref:hypothetical protein n=1 Tax=Mycobacterium scrofulaceum TaxID=1783 RepID=UPI0009F39C45|nr:hypothetical protein [Mycobacterium scrofulaceum]